jgi:hypothetical protein
MRKSLLVYNVFLNAYDEDLVDIMFLYVGFEVFTVVVMKSIIFWNMTCLLAGFC